MPMLMGVVIGSGSRMFFGRKEIVLKVEKKKGMRICAYSPKSSQSGFTLIEVVIVIAIMAILAGAMAPMALRSLDGTRIDQTKTRVKATYEAIMGPEGNQGTGFLGDVGRLPNNLTELVAQSGLPAYTEAGHVANVGMGWRGPYVTDGVLNSQPVDGWGVALAFANGQVRSAGSNHIANDADDIVYPTVATPGFTGLGTVTINVSVFDGSGAGAYVPSKGAGATFYRAFNGAQQNTVVIAPVGGPYSTQLSQGIHAIAITGQDPDGAGPALPPQAATVTVYCRAGMTVTQTVGLRP
jgi:prepilin-type N-terminal cleavage/methylation domain-containing protein